MSREPIFPRRHTMCVQITLEVADAVVQRARREHIPQRAVVEAALRQYFHKPGVWDEEARPQRWVSVGEQIGIDELANAVSEECGPVVKGGAK